MRAMQRTLLRPERSYEDSDFVLGLSQRAANKL
jgi:hypothetical protein